MRLPAVSGAGTWLKCHASHQAQIKHPRLDPTPSQAILEGRVCHNMLEELLKGGTLTAGVLDPKWGIVRTQAMIDAVVKARSVLPKTSHVEVWINLSMIRQGWYGYADVSYMDMGHEILNIYDVKFGHTYVEVEENPQLIPYAIGKARALGLPPDTRVKLHIVQPREYRSGEHFHRTWETTVGELDNYIPMYQKAIENAMSPAPTATTGSQCKYCSARAYCNTLRDVSYDVIDFSDLLSTSELTGEQIGVDLTLVKEALERLKYMESALEEQAIHGLQSGKSIKGWGVKSVQSSPRWKADALHAVKSIGMMYGVTVTKPEELLTPNQIIKLNVDKSVISSYTEQTSSMKLVQQSANDIAKLFKD